jgi:murein DD-endopeptidase MepM/ murein hydrolase activator NlpD
MPFPAKTSKVRLLGQVAAVAVLAGASAGCSSDVTRFGTLFDNTSNRSQIVQGDAVVTGSLAPAPTTAVASNALPPPVGSSSYPPPVSQAPMVQTAAVSPTAGGTIYVVQPGDSLGRIANDRGLRSMELASFNGIDPAAPIKVGQRLRIPDGAAGAPSQVASLQTNSNTATDGQLGVIPVRPPVALAPAVPAPTATPTVPTGQPVATEVPVRNDPAPIASGGDQVVASVPSQAATQPQVTTGTGVESSTTGNFRWPVRGRVISAYGVKASGERNDGINIEVPEGTPIKAAEGGTVIYAGNELKGYGNLVLIKHPNGFVSAYAHASEILVKRDDVIMRGQTIGKVGTTGNVPRPQLHFEIRQGNKPVDPIPHLSG